MWQVLRDIDDLLKEEPERETVSIKELDRIKSKRYKKEVFRNKINLYLRESHKGISDINREDLAIMAEGLEGIDLSMFMDEIRHTLETNYGKPLKWIIANKKTNLFVN